MNEKRNILSGILLERAGEAVDRIAIECFESIQYEGLVGHSKWEKFSYKSDKPCKGEAELGIEPPYIYRLVMRRSGPRILILSSNRRIVEHLLNTELRDGFVPNFKPVSIAVSGLVRAIVEKPEVYVLTFVHARVPAFGDSLRSISFYGDDLAEATLFRDHIYLMDISTCGLRYAMEHSELVRLSSDGSISFRLTHLDKVLKVEKAISFLRKKGYLSTDILPEG